MWCSGLGKCGNVQSMLLGWWDGYFNMVEGLKPYQPLFSEQREAFEFSLNGAKYFTVL